MATAIQRTRIVHEGVDLHLSDNEAQAAATILALVQGTGVLADEAISIRQALAEAGVYVGEHEAGDEINRAATHRTATLVFGDL